MPTQAQWLAILTHNEPPHLQWVELAYRIFHNTDRNHQLPVHRVPQQPTARRLKSRHPPWERATTPRLSLEERWRAEWDATAVRNKYLISNPTTELLDMDLNRLELSKLNRNRTGQDAMDT
ncbi:unnamed protein product [Soboliphyme baturini]|uniref:Uncharacterized protein n=1 Tax=Soboliphyme baturini TaxID=241478 RepID=A0A183JB17_9BILA|nr:unnamed protein product [Soboliphyme baturini]